MGGLVAVGVIQVAHLLHRQIFLGHIRLAQRVFDTFGFWRPLHSYLVMHVDVVPGRPEALAILGLKGRGGRYGGNFFFFLTPLVKPWDTCFVKGEESIGTLLCACYTQ